MRTRLSIATVLLAASALSAAPLGENERTSWVSLTADEPIREFSGPAHQMTLDSYFETSDLAAIEAATLLIRLTSDDIALNDAFAVPIAIPAAEKLQQSLSIPIDVAIPPGQVEPVTVRAEAEWTLQFAAGGGAMIASDQTDLYFVPPSTFGGPRFDLKQVRSDGELFEVAPGEQVETYILITNNSAGALHAEGTADTSVVSTKPAGADGSATNASLSPDEVEARLNDIFDRIERRTDSSDPTEWLVPGQGSRVARVTTTVPTGACPGSAYKANATFRVADFAGRTSDHTVSTTVFVNDEASSGPQFIEQGKTGLFSMTEAGPGLLKFADDSQRRLGDVPAAGGYVHSWATRARFGFGYPGWAEGREETETIVGISSSPVSYEYRTTTLRGIGVVTATHNRVIVLLPPDFEGPLEIPEAYIGPNTPANVEIVIDLRAEPATIKFFNPGTAPFTGELVWELELADFNVYGTQLSEPLIPLVQDFELIPARDTCMTLLVRRSSTLSAAPPVLVGSPALPSLRIFGGSGGGQGLPGDYTVLEPDGIDALVEPLPNGEASVDLDWTFPPDPTPAVTVRWLDIEGGALRVPMIGRTPIGPPPPDLEVTKAKGATKPSSESKDSVKFVIRFVATDTSPNKRREPLPTECRDVAVEFGGSVARLELNGRGRGKSDDRKRSIKAKVKTDAEGTQLITLKCRFKAQSFFGRLTEFGFADETIVRPGIRLFVPVRAVWCGQLYAGVAEVVYRATEGRKGRFKTTR